MRGDILGGLKLAVSKGESLKQAMISFHNAGYKKEDIEGAARALHQIQQPLQPKEQILKQKPIQKVSSYGKEPGKFKEKLVLFLLIFVLIILLGTLAGVFFFKSELTGFLNDLFV